AINDRDKAWHDLYELSIDSGKLELIFENTSRITGWNFDWDEEPRLAYITGENGFSQIWKIEEGKPSSMILETNLQEIAYVAGWNEDNSLFYLVTNLGSNDLSALYLMDPVSLKMEMIENDPDLSVDFGSL